MEKEKGSILILTIIAVLILSMVVGGLLNVGTTEFHTTQNYYLNKSAYYTAVGGVEEIRDSIFANPDPTVVAAITRSIYETQEDEDRGVSRAYMTGTVKDRETGSFGIAKPVEKFEGFEAPPLPALSLGSSVSISPVVWKVTVTADVTVGGKKAYSEIVAGIYSVVTSGY